MPERVQLSRRKGFRLPAGTINCARPGPWGNPWRVVEEYGQWHVKAAAHTTGRFQTREAAIDRAIAEHRLMILAHPREAIAQLRGHDLACWCKLGDPCHADVLLELANR